MGPEYLSLWVHNEPALPCAKHICNLHNQTNQLFEMPERLDVAHSES